MFTLAFVVVVADPQCLPMLHISCIFSIKLVGIETIEGLYVGMY